MGVLRAALVGVALVACAWFAVGARQAHDVSAAANLISPGHPLRPGQADRARSLLDAAAWLNPDRQVDILRAELARDQGELRAAQTRLERVVQAEPQNLQAWILLARYSRGAPATFRLAVETIERLLPSP